jgi:hypothetical protein
MLANDNYFVELAAVDCSAHVEKKGKFTYLSWPFAVSELAKRHPDAEIEVHEWDGFPAIRHSKGWMVKVSVTVKGVRRTQWHPVLNNGNAPILEPSVFELNTSIQRATVKAIALHGLGLYIYAGEDLPEGAEPEPEPVISEEQAAEIRDNLESTGSDTAKFCAAFGCESVGTLPVAKYPAAMAALKRKAAQAA